ncbi:unnamed protein product [Sphagnum balticum]
MCCQVTGVIRNFIWGGKDATARAKVKWETLALPIAQGGLGVTDPKSQSKVLLAKLFVKGLATGGEPWKELVWHKADQTRLPVHGKGPNNPDFNWFLAAPKLKRLQCSMWNNIIGAWLNVRLGLTKSDLTTAAETLRHPLFGNPSILSASGTPLDAPGCNSWESTRYVKSVTPTRKNPHNTAYWSAPWRNAPGKRTKGSGTNGKRPTTLRSPGPLFSLEKRPSSTTTTHPSSSLITLVVSLTLGSHLTSFVVSSYTTSSLKDVGDTLVTSIP